MISNMNQFLKDNQITQASFKQKSTKIRILIVILLLICGIVDVAGATQMQIPTASDTRVLAAGYHITKKQAANISKMPTLVTVDKRSKTQYGAIAALRPAKIVKKKNPNYDPHAKMPSTKMPTKKFMAKLKVYEATRDKYRKILKFTGGASLRFVFVSQQTGRPTDKTLPLINHLETNPMMSISRLSRHHYFDKIKMTTNVRRVQNDQTTVKAERIDGFKHQTWKVHATPGNHVIKVAYGYAPSVIKQFKSAKAHAIQAAILVWLVLILLVWVVSGIFVTGAQASKDTNDDE